MAGARACARVRAMPCKRVCIDASHDSTYAVDAHRAIGWGGRLSFKSTLCLRELAHEHSREHLAVQLKTAQPDGK
eukprot:13750410-Alexandrium_andersonii.AAC.1